jgi:hypothetical protein
MQLQLKQHDYDPEKDRPLTPYFIVLVVQGSNVAKSVFSHRSLRPVSKGGDVKHSRVAFAMQMLPVLRAQAAYLELCMWVTCGDGASI